MALVEGLRGCFFFFKGENNHLLSSFYLASYIGCRGMFRHIKAVPRETARNPRDSTKEMEFFYVLQKNGICFAVLAGSGRNCYAV